MSVVLDTNPSAQAPGPPGPLAPPPARLPHTAPHETSSLASLAAPPAGAASASATRSPPPPPCIYAWIALCCYYKSYLTPSVLPELLAQGKEKESSHIIDMIDAALPRAATSAERIALLEIKHICEVLVMFMLPRTQGHTDMTPGLQVNCDRLEALVPHVSSPLLGAPPTPSWGWDAASWLLSPFQWLLAAGLWLLPNWCKQSFAPGFIEKVPCTINPETRAATLALLFSFGPNIQGIEDALGTPDTVGTLYDNALLPQIHHLEAHFNSLRYEANRIPFQNDVFAPLSRCALLTVEAEPGDNITTTTVENWRENVIAIRAAINSI